MFDTIRTTLSAAVAQSGTFTVGYPTGRDSGAYVGAYKHKLSAMGYVFEAPAGFTVSFGTSNITVTYLGATTIPAATCVILQLDKLGTDDATLRTDVADTHNVVPVTPFLINLGAPDVADADGISASQSVGAAALALINGALAAGGVATFDVPRNVVGAWTTNSVVTVTGTDEYGAVVKEACASGATFTGKKAFKTITSILSSASITSATFGSGDVLGLPVALPQKGLVLGEMEDGAAPTAGTLVAAVRSVATSTTGDVRGTYDPNSACDGAKAFSLVATLADPTDKGVAQFAG